MPGYYERDPDHGAAYIPTPEQIEAAKREIRSGWSAAETSRRAGIPWDPKENGPALKYEVPMFKTVKVRAGVNRDLV